MKTKLSLNLLKVVRPGTLGSLQRYFRDSEVGVGEKALLPLAAAYVVVPVDLIPELVAMTAGTALAGPIGAIAGLLAGLSDDAFVAAWLIGKLDGIRHDYPKKPRS